MRSGGTPFAFRSHKYDPLPCPLLDSASHVVGCRVSSQLAGHFGMLLCEQRSTIAGLQHIEPGIHVIQLLHNDAQTCPNDYIFNPDVTLG